MASDRVQHAASALSRAWMVSAWGAVPWSPAHDAQTWDRWRHVRTIVLECGDGEPAQGESIWAYDADGEPAAVAWEWIEWHPGVVLLKDPMSIVSNLAWNCGDDDPPAMSRILALNRIPHALPWQDEVLRALSRTEPHDLSSLQDDGATADGPAGRRAGGRPRMGSVEQLPAPGRWPIAARHQPNG